MTSETFNRAMGILSDKEICTFAERLCEKWRFDPKAEYPQTVDSQVMTGAARRLLYLHRTSNLLRRAIYLGATTQEVVKIAIYLVVIMKSIDLKLDYRQCEKDVDISGLSKKYSESEFLEMDLDVDELEYALKRDNDFYEVKIKDEDR